MQSNRAESSDPRLAFMGRSIAHKESYQVTIFIISLLVKPVVLFS